MGVGFGVFVSVCRGERRLSAFVLRYQTFFGQSRTPVPTGTVEVFALSVGYAATITPKEEFLPK